MLHLDTPTFMASKEQGMTAFITRQPHYGCDQHRWRVFKDKAQNKATRQRCQSKKESEKCQPLSL